VRGERGSISVVTAGVALLALVLASLTADLARVLVASSRAQTAADLAALAAAQELAMPTGLDPEVVAGEYAARNGGTLAACTCRAGDLEAVVTVRVATGPLLLLPGERSVTGRSRAVVEVPS